VEKPTGLVGRKKREAHTKRRRSRSAARWKTD
jgi:hypothetical protein